MTPTRSPSPYETKKLDPYHKTAKRVTARPPETGPNVQTAGMAPGCYRKLPTCR